MLNANIYNSYFNGTFTVASMVNDDAAGISGATCCVGVGTETQIACRSASTYYTSGGNEYCARTSVTYPYDFGSQATVGDNVSNVGYSTTTNFYYDGTAPIS